MIDLFSSIARFYWVELKKDDMGRSQETFLKKQREKERAKKKMAKREKRDSKKGDASGGAKIDWESAPNNLTLTDQEEKLKSQNQSSNLNK